MVLMVLGYIVLFLNYAFHTGFVLQKKDSVPFWYQLKLVYSLYSFNPHKPEEVL